MENLRKVIFIGSMGSPGMLMNAPEKDSRKIDGQGNGHVFAHKKWWKHIPILRYIQA